MTDTLAPGTSRQLVDLNDLSAEAAIARIIEHAAGMGASDLFILANEQHMAIQVRHLGLMQLISVIPIEQGRRLIAHIKARAGMDVSEKRRPMDGRWVQPREDAEPVDLRVNTIPTMFGEDCAIRLLSRQSQLHSLDNLGMTRDQLHQVTAMLDSPGGIILTTGPTGSGKTATLYACLRRLNDGKRKINTIEDPVEFTVDGLRQAQINPHISLGFAELLRSVLRQAPDVIMIGEIRDTETAETAVRAANSGHLVLATIHAPVAAAAVQSMRSLGVHPHFLSTALRGVITQRLVRTLCPKCRTSFDLSLAPHTFDDVKQWLAPDEGKVLYAAQGCAECGMSGYAERTGVYEVLPVSRGIRNLIAEGRPTREIHAKAVEERMLEFRHAALLKVARGQTSTEEVFRVIPPEHLLVDE